jgi:hypothetical protein
MFSKFVRWWWRGRNVTAPTDNRNSFSVRARSLRPSQPSNIRIALLSLLEGEPKHAYELMQRLRRKNCATAALLFPALQRLVDEGL